MTRFPINARPLPPKAGATEWRTAASVLLYLGCYERLATTPGALGGIVKQAIRVHCPTVLKGTLSCPRVCS